MNYELMTILMLQTKQTVPEHSPHGATCTRWGNIGLHNLCTSFTKKYSCILTDGQAQTLFRCRDWSRQSKYI